MKELQFTASDGVRFTSMSNNFAACTAYLTPFGICGVQRSVLMHLNEGDTYVDVGANIGTWAIRAAQQVGPQGRVLAFEAHPRTFGFLQRNIGLNSIPNVTALNLAVGATEKHVTLDYIQENAGETHVAPENRIGSVRVQMRRLDDVVAEFGISKIDYLKIDVEGFELPVLEGARRIIAASPRIVVQTELVERHASRYGRSVREVIEFALSLGLKPHVASADGRLMPLNVFEFFGDRDVLWTW